MWHVVMGIIAASGWVCAYQINQSWGRFHVARFREINEGWANFTRNLLEGLKISLFSQVIPGSRVTSIHAHQCKDEPARTYGMMAFGDACPFCGKDIEVAS